MRVDLVIAVAVAALPAAALAQGAGVSPGQWEIASTIKSIDMPGGPPGIAAMMTGKTTTIRYCITPEQAARGPQDMLKSAKGCSFTRYNLVGGKFDSEMVCKQGGGTMTATGSGTFTPTSFTSTGRSVATGSMAMTMTTVSTGKRVGDCK